MTTLERHPQDTAAADRVAARSSGRPMAAEFRRHHSTSGWWLLTLGAVALPVLGTVGVGVSIGKDGGLSAADPSTVGQVLSNGFAAGLVAAILGALAVTTEFRHHSAAGAVLDVGSRVRWVAAKAPMVMAWGFALTCLGQAATLLSGTLLLEQHGLHPDLWHGPLLATTIGTALVGIPCALWGLAIGLLVRSQLGAVAGLILYSMFAEAALIHFVPSVGAALPGGAQAAIVSDPTLDYHHTFLGWLVFLGWIAVAGLLGLRRLSRSDLPA